MKPGLNVNMCQIVLHDSEDDVTWVYINMENRHPDETGSIPRINIEIPVRLNGNTDQISPDSEAIRKAKALLSHAVASL